ncbi:MAG: hypothetical protein ABIH86_06590 [Planctomycetota bacterium]
MADNVWFGNASWPSNRSCGEFAKDVFRIAGAKTDKQKALAFYDWFTRCMMRGPNLFVPTAGGGYTRSYDPLSVFTSWGFGECTDWGWVATEALCAAGVKARRVVVHNMGHTYYEIWYKGDDGKEQWHAFDPFGGWFFMNRSGEVASCEELAADPQLAQNPLPGHPVPLGHHPDRANLAHRHRTEDQLFIDQPIRDDKNNWSLLPGMEVTMTFIPETPSQALFAGKKQDDGTVIRPQGGHCDMTPLSKLGFLQHKQHLPYWENYLLPSQEISHMNEGRPVRWHGCGALRWKPLQQGAGVAELVKNAVFENGVLRPKGTHDFAEVWYHFKLPFLATFIQVDYDVAGGGGDYFGICLSADGRRSLWPMPMKKNGPGYGVTSNGQADWRAGRASVQGLKEFWLRIDMTTHQARPSLAVQGFDVTVGFQHNMFIQPRLVPGQNALWLERGSGADNDALTAEWIYQLNGDERRETLSLAKGSRAEKTVSIDASSPADVKMTGMKLRCESGSQR